MQSSMDQAAYQADGTIKEYQIAPSENGFIGLYGQLEAQGSYFPLDDLFMPEFFSRPLNETDLIGMTVADMKILRNQYYAVHGRIFEKQELKDYFQEKHGIWEIKQRMNLTRPCLAVWKKEILHF